MKSYNFSAIESIKILGWIETQEEYDEIKRAVEEVKLTEKDIDVTTDNCNLFYNRKFSLLEELIDDYEQNKDDWENPKPEYINVGTRMSELCLEIERCKKEFPDFMDWGIAIECVFGTNLRHHRRHWDNSFLRDEENWLYIICSGRNTVFPNEKIFTINADF